MADKNITIALKTSGANQAAADFGRVESALEGIGNTAPKVAGQIDKVADAAGQLGTGKGGYGSKGGAGSAALELSRAFEDAQYGIRGVLNNIPSLIFALGGGAGLAGVISIAAVAASTLWTKFSGGATKAKEESNDLLETFKQLVEVYTQLDLQSAQDREKAAKLAADNLKNSISGINTRVSIQTDESTLDAAREKAAAQLQLAQDRLRVGELEQRIAVSGGTDALQLAKEREATIRRIYDTELQISDVGRKQALAAAEAKTAGAGETLGKVTADAQGKAATLAAKEAEQQKIVDELYALTTARVKLLEETKAKIIRENEILSKLALESGNYELAADIKRREPDEIARAQEKLGAPSFKEQDLAAQATALDGPIKALAEQSKAANDAQQEAARAMNEAARALIQIKETQDVERRSEAELKATEAIGEVGRDVTQAAKDAIDAIQNNAASQGRAPNANEQDAIDRAQKLLADTTPDAEQGGQLAGILQSVANNLTAKDQILAGGLEKLIGIAQQQMVKYQQLVQRIDTLSAAVGSLAKSVGKLEEASQKAAQAASDSKSQANQTK